MPCYHPLRAWRTPAGEVKLSKEPIDGQFLLLPCGNCLGCRTNRAQAWALRCHLELQDHNDASFTTLTYEESTLPLTLQRRELTLWLKRLRKRTETHQTRIRFFATGEYGDRTHRPHYHAILYGLAATPYTDRLIQDTWGKGHTRTEAATPASISYVAGYCNKKIGYRREPHERVDTETGEVYTWQPPFIQMSRRPGIGANAKQFLQSWSLYAIKDGHKMPVPRYFKEHYKNTATKEDLEKLERAIDALNIKPLTNQQLRAAEKIAEAKHKLQGEKRKL